MCGDRELLESRRTLFTLSIFDNSFKAPKKNVLKISNSKNSRTKSYITRHIFYHSYKSLFCCLFGITNSRVKMFITFSFRFIFFYILRPQPNLEFFKDTFVFIRGQLLLENTFSLLDTPFCQIMWLPKRFSHAIYKLARYIFLMCINEQVSPH